MQRKTEGETGDIQVNIEASSSKENKAQQARKAKNSWFLPIFGLSILVLVGLLASFRKYCYGSSIVPISRCPCRFSLLFAFFVSRQMAWNLGLLFAMTLPPQRRLCLYCNDITSRFTFSAMTLLAS
jgi:hypothetical protein